MGNISADEALQRLIAGNERFVNDETRPSAPLHQTLTGLAEKQQPFATILGCSDSRVPPELVFDAELGELFVIRVAGNGFSDQVAASLQYAGAHLNTQLFMVLGHQGCGAVAAALKTRDDGHQHHCRIQLLVDSMLPGLPEFDLRLSEKARLTQAVESNVRRTVHQIIDSPIARVPIAEGRVKVIGAVYELVSGQVRLLD